MRIPYMHLTGDESVTNLADADDRFFHNLSIRYRDPNRRFQVIVGVRNIFDVSPPVVGWGAWAPASCNRRRLQYPAWRRLQPVRPQDLRFVQL